MKDSGINPISSFVIAKPDQTRKQNIYFPGLHNSFKAIFSSDSWGE